MSKKASGGAGVYWLAPLRQQRRDDGTDDDAATTGTTNNRPADWTTLAGLGNDDGGGGNAGGGGQVESVRLRVTLRRLSGGTQPGTPDTGGTQATSRATDQITAKTVTTVFKWQKKILSPSEVERFHTIQSEADLDKFTPHQRTQYAEFQKLEAKQAASGRGKLKGSTLFCYVHKDNFFDLLQMFPPPTTSTSAKFSPLEQKLIQTLASGSHPPETLPSSSEGHPVSLGTVQNGVSPLLNIYKGSIVMYIMAAIRSGDHKAPSQTPPQTWTGSEHILCEVRFFPQTGRLELRPDLNNTLHPYYKFTTEDGQEFEWAISSPTSNPTKHEPSKSSAAQVDSITRRSVLQQNRAALQTQQTYQFHNFVPPPTDPSLFRAYIFGEVMESINFPDNNTFIEFFIHIPEGWIPKQPLKDLSSVTHITDPVWGPPTDGICICCSGSGSCTNGCSFTPRSIAHFNHPFELEAESPPSFTTPSNENSCPVMYFKVQSRDRWNCNRVLGYGHAKLIPATGSHTLHIQTWMPAPTVRQQLREHFIGASIELQDLAYLSGAADIPDSTTNSTLSRYGFETTPTGIVVIRYNCILQSKGTVNDQEEFSRPTQMESQQGLHIDSNNKGTMNSTKADVAAAVARAKRRLKELRAQRGE
ncbi:centriole proteome protein [Pelomyxa schiedti]|nr:centriole proteome protein [Pelomyxa schiedti]